MGDFRRHRSLPEGLISSAMSVREPLIDVQAHDLVGNASLDY